MSTSQDANEALAQHRADCATCQVRGAAKCSVGRKLTKAWLRAKTDEYQARKGRFRYWSGYPRHKFIEFTEWLFKREQWTDEPIDGTERVHLSPSRWEGVKEWTAAFAQIVLALLCFYAVPRFVYALYVGFRAFMRVLLHWSTWLN